MNFIIFSLLFAPLVRCNVRVRRIVGGEPANYPPYDDPVVYIRFNGRAAKVQGVREFPHYVFKGIKFAHPPTGQDRFLVSKAFFEKTTTKKKIMLASERKIFGRRSERNKIPTSLRPTSARPKPNCWGRRLFGFEHLHSRFTFRNRRYMFITSLISFHYPVNFIPGLPVTIFIHGGGFRYGSASQYGVSYYVISIIDEHISFVGQTSHQTRIARGLYPVSFRLVGFPQFRLQAIAWQCRTVGHGFGREMGPELYRILRGKPAQNRRLGSRHRS